MATLPWEPTHAIGFELQCEAQRAGSRKSAERTNAKTTTRGSHVHVELVDFDRFITLWQGFYPKLKDEDKALLPLVPVYFYAPPS